MLSNFTKLYQQVKLGKIHRIYGVFKMIKLKLHEKIKMLRKMNDMTQEDLAYELGMSVNSYAQLERGETKSINSDKLNQILNLFHMNFLDFLSLGEVGKVCLVHNDNQMEGDNNRNEVTIVGHTEMSDLISGLKKEIDYKDELLAQKDKQIALLENLVAILQNKTSD